MASRGGRRQGVPSRIRQAPLHDIDFGGTRAVGIILQMAAQNGALIGDFRRNDRAGNRQGRFGLGRLVLRAPQKDVPGLGTLDSRGQLARIRQKGNRDAGLGREGHQGGRNGDLAETDDLTQKVGGRAGAGPAIDLDSNRFAVFAQICALACHIERVKQFLHSGTPARAMRSAIQPVPMARRPVGRQRSCIEQAPQRRTS